MYKKWCSILIFHLVGIVVFAQVNPSDTALKKIEPPVIDTSLDYSDIMFDDLEKFLDSILSPHSYTLTALSIQKGYFNYKSKTEIFLEPTRKVAFTPGVGYYNKCGLGITGIGSFVSDDQAFRFYQFAISPSYDYLENKDLATGISYTRYFTKDSLPFYTSPLQNEVYAYFTYRKWWVKPMVGVSYGWGSRSDYQEREEYITSLQLRRTGFTRINTKESVNDFSVIASVRHDFYWLDVFAYNDHIRVSPQLTFTSGSQKFGFNQSSNTYATLQRSGANVLYNSENVYLDNKLYFQPLALTFYLKTEYSIGKFYIQPQLILDYYFPASDKQFLGLVSVSGGFIF
jgi:hypothetical protein